MNSPLNIGVRFTVMYQLMYLRRRQRLEEIGVTLMIQSYGLFDLDKPISDEDQSHGKPLNSLISPSEVDEFYEEVSWRFS